MDTHNIQQKDFLSSMFPSEQQNHHHQQVLDGRQQSHSTMSPIFHYNQGSPVHQHTIGGMQQQIPQTINPQLTMDLLGNVIQMQGIESQSTNPTSPQAYNPHTLLEQQFKLTQLQQLQQLQNQIFQQQIALISSQTAGILQASPPLDIRRDQQAQFNGLPTPGSSAELQPQPSLEYVSPMLLNNSYIEQSQGSYRADSMVNPAYAPSRGSTSAPEHIAFRTSPSHPSPADLDFDISPLTSPWLGAHHQSLQQQSSNKRQASSSGDEGNNQPSRKKQSPAIRPTQPNQGKKTVRTSKSTNSTPQVRSTRSRKGSTAGDAIGDTPSPVDLSMPPPAPPASSSSSGSPVPSSPNFNPQPTPATPASFMNLNRPDINNSGLAPPTKHTASSKANAEKILKAATKPRFIIEPSRNARKTTTGSLVSPSLKALLPAGTTPPMLPIPSPAIAHTAPVVHVRKTSHKAAEQKRRDSLKTTFDDLRGLLPPIPLPTDEKYADEPILPGALPPRGPPKAGGEGPNKAVSKLQLLMCGNDYIRQLKGRVERRDEEIERLRREVKRLRHVLRSTNIPERVVEGEAEELDLERDLDAIEVFSGGLDIGGGGLVLGDDDGDDDPGE